MIVQNMAALCPYRIGDYLQTENPTNPALSWPGTSWVPAIPTPWAARAAKHSIRSLCQRFRPISISSTDGRSKSNPDSVAH